MDRTSIESGGSDVYEATHCHQKWNHLPQIARHEIERFGNHLSQLKGEVNLCMAGYEKLWGMIGFNGLAHEVMEKKFNSDPMEYAVHGPAKTPNGDIWYNKNYYGEIV